MNVRAVIDSAGDFATGNTALAVVEGTGPEITGGAIYYGNLRVARVGAIVIHELGHHLGLNHSTEMTDVMGPPGSAANFSARERLLISLMLQRRAGNRFPDDDAYLGAVSGSRWTHLIDCRDPFD